MHVGAWPTGNRLQGVSDLIVTEAASEDAKCGHVGLTGIQQLNNSI